ncbi:MAG: DEAD/DEAH box helicase [Ignavibacteriaceae bacterium]|nr:DEAD/DEAH box helicase [Ignavibacteriaceae bacterium]
MSFEKLNLIQPLQTALSNEGYTIPTPIQSQAIPVILERRDLIGCAQTGTGKTAAFALPILQILSEEKRPHKSKRIIKSLILTPTRELAVQIGESFKAYGNHTRLKNAVVFGGVSQRAQTMKLREGVDILIATPGRLLDLINQRYISLNTIKIFVLDEADRMLDMGFINDVKKIIEKLPSHRQTLLFSATMPSEITKLANSILADPVKIEVSPEQKTVEAVRQAVYFVTKSDKKKLLIHLLKNENIESALVFTRTKRSADVVTRVLNDARIHADSIHGNKSQQARQRALNNFKLNRTRVLVATDIAARGIDIEKLSHVFNYDIPEFAEAYIHRIGRTARAGLGGTALSFCDPEEISNLSAINRLIKQPISVVADHPYKMLDIKDGENPAVQNKFNGRSRSLGFGKSTRNRSGRSFRKFKAKS